MSQGSRRGNGQGMARQKVRKSTIVATLCGQAGHVFVMSFIALSPNTLHRQDFSIALDFCDWIYEITRSRTSCESEGSVFDVLAALKDGHALGELIAGHGNVTRLTCRSNMVEAQVDFLTTQSARVSTCRLESPLDMA